MADIFDKIDEKGQVRDTSFIGDDGKSEIRSCLIIPAKDYAELRDAYRGKEQVEE